MSLCSRLRILGALGVASLGPACARPALQERNAAAAVGVAKLAPMEVAMLSATLDTLVRRMRDSSSLCVSILGGPEGPEVPSADFLGSLRIQRSVVAMDRCPPTYTQMIVVVDSQGRPVGPARPAGYVDPYRLEIGRPQFASYGYGWVYARQLQGTVGRDYVCTVIRQSAETRVVCNVHSDWIH